MTADTLLPLERIGSKSGTTRRDLLTITRRIVRHLYELRRSIRAERQALSRQANKLRQSGPLTQRRADALEQQARDHNAEELAGVVDVLEDYGRVLVLDHEGYATTLGFEALADLPNINRVDRERALRNGWFHLTDLVAIEGLENSAERRGGDWEFRHSPLRWRVCWHWPSCTPVRRINCPSRERLAVSASAPPWLFTTAAVRVWWRVRWVRFQAGIHGNDRWPMQARLSSKAAGAGTT